MASCGQLVAGSATPGQGATVDGGSGQPVAWRSSIPGVSQRDGAPASLGLPGRGLHAASTGEAGGQGDRVGPPIGPAGDGRSGGWRHCWVVPWRAIALALVALVAIVGVARAAGVHAGAAPGTVASGTVAPGWGPVAGGSVTASSAPDPLGGSVAASSAPLASGPDAAPGDQSPDWWAVLAELDRRRVHALSAANTALLSSFAQPGSPAWEEDATLLADLSARGVHPQGLSSRVLAVERVDRDGPVSRLQVVDQRTGYSMVNSLGEVVQRVEAAGPRRWAVTLSRMAPVGTGPAPGAGMVPESSAPPSPSSGPDPGWRVTRVTPVGSEASDDVP